MNNRRTITASLSRTTISWEKDCQEERRASICWFWSTSITLNHRKQKTCHSSCWSELTVSLFSRQSCRWIWLICRLHSWFMHNSFHSWSTWLSLSHHNLFDSTVKVSSSTSLILICDWHLFKRKEGALTKCKMCCYCYDIIIISSYAVVLSSFSCQALYKCLILPKADLNFPSFHLCIWCLLFLWSRLWFSVSQLERCLSLLLSLPDFFGWDSTRDTKMTIRVTIFLWRRRVWQ